MDQPIILNEWDYEEEDVAPAPDTTALTEAMAGTAMTLSEMEEWFGPSL